MGEVRELMDYLRWRWAQIAYWWRRWSPASIARRTRNRFQPSLRVNETITLETPSGEGKVVIPAGKDGAWEVYARGELITKGSSAAILPQCLVEASAASARERGYVVVADEFFALGVSLLEEQDRAWAA